MMKHQGPVRNITVREQTDELLKSDAHQKILLIGV